MENLPQWKEPNAYHRYCLRHIRSNFSGRFRNKTLRKLCWSIGSTSQNVKYRWAVSEMRLKNQEAWDYLNNIDKTKWTVRHDKEHRRWGNLTTNISESMNNVLREARLLPITALIDYTFRRDVEQYVKHTQISSVCNTPLPPRIWSRYESLLGVAMQHEVTMYDANALRCNVLSRVETNDRGGNDYTVEYKKKVCSCGKWQMQRFPCSHAIAVCNWLGKSPHSITSWKFHTDTYIQQYNSHFYTLGHKSEWPAAEWRIQGDPSMITTHRGRVRQRRIQNEMDVNNDDRPRRHACTRCGETGHNRKSCGNARRQRNQ